MSDVEDVTFLPGNLKIFMDFFVQFFVPTVAWDRFPMGYNMVIKIVLVIYHTITHQKTCSPNLSDCDCSQNQLIELYDSEFCENVWCRRSDIFDVIIIDITKHMFDF